MEDALVLGVGYLAGNKEAVLILVLMEDALVHLETVLHDYRSQS